MRRISKKKELPKSVKDLSQEQLAEILKKKKECNSKALKIVETMSETAVSQEWMLNQLFEINQSHYIDVTTERSIIKLCGYPLCAQELENVPTQQFRISLSSKTVFDITERKKYCSSKCFKASEFLKNQLLTSPLWYRENESCPNFKLLEEPFSENLNKSEEPYETEKLRISDNANVEDATGEGNKEIDCNDHTREENTIENSGITQIAAPSSIETNGPTEDAKNSVLPSRPDEKIASPPLKPTEKRCNHLAENEKDPVAKVEQNIKEWFTINTYVHLLGEERLREEFEGCHDMLKVLGKQGPRTKKFEEISRIFSILNLGDGGDDRDTQLKPVPDFSVLKSVTQDLTIKVRAFYTGQLETEEGKQKVVENGEGVEEAGEMPLVDSQAQNALRRRLVLDRLNKVVLDISLSLGLADSVPASDIRELVHTFALSAHNVTFSPREAFITALVIIKLLSLKDKVLSAELVKEDAKTRTGLVLMSFGLELDYLDNLTEWLIDKDRLIATLKPTS